MSDQIQIKDLLLRAIIGINEDERRSAQDVLINVTLWVDTRTAGSSDAIDDAVNYRTITKRIIGMVEGSRFYLVEKMAEGIAAICLDEPRVQRASVRVEKPGALRFARSVGVEIERARSGMAPINRALVSLGSNIQPVSNLKEAVRHLDTHSHLLAVSRVYETEPVGRPGQSRFLNAAVILETNLAAFELKDRVLRSIESDLGRVRTEDRYGPRTIDLDISLFNDEQLTVAGGNIPDPEILEFPHIARPLADVAPHHRHPVTGQTLLDIAEAMSQDGLKQRDDVVLWRASQDTKHGGDH